MAASPAVLNSASYAAETTFAENLSTVSTLRLPLCAPVDTSGLKHSLIDPTPYKQNAMDGVAWIPGTMEGSFKTKLWLCGHGSDTSGATTIGLTETLICNYVLGSGAGAAVSAASGTAATGGTAAAWTTTASGTFTAGSLCALGILGDAHGNGQVYPVGTHVTTTLTPLCQPQGAPSGTDKLWSGVTGHTNSTTTTQASARFLLQSKGYQYLCHGCVPTACTWGGLNDGEVPYVEITWSVAWWEYSIATFPSSVTTETFTPSSNAAGSFWVNTVGTATNQYRNTIRSFTIEHTLGTIMLPGPGGVNQFQKFVGAIRGPDTVKVSFTDDSESTTTTPYWQGLQLAGTAQHMCRTLSTAAGKRMGLYFPNLNFCDEVSTQMNDGGINRVKVAMVANTGPVTTSELTKSAMRVYFG